MYATVADAQAYLDAYYSSTNPLKAKWKALSDEDKQVMLNRASQLIDQLPLSGKAVEPPKAFPRLPFAEQSLEQAKQACVELAVQSLDELKARRIELRAQGVYSYKIGDLSETLAPGASSKTDETLSIVAPFLQIWLGGGYDICHTRMRR